jgi:hypothetical protein
MPGRRWQKYQISPAALCRHTQFGRNPGHQSLFQVLAYPVLELVKALFESRTQVVKKLTGIINDQSYYRYDAQKDGLE